MTVDAGAPAHRTSAEVAARAAYVLRAHDQGALTVAAPRLYPHMWSWDAAFIAIGLARLSPGRALAELETLFGAQWRTGMVPHIVFADTIHDYVPGPDRWRCQQVCTDAPRTRATSGLIQPPVHAIAVRRILEATRYATPAERRQVTLRIRLLWPRLLAWHRYLAEQRDPGSSGLVTIYHSWESGMDNSPRWDGPYAAVRPGPGLPPYRRADLSALGESRQRPSDAEYDRYLWLVEELRAARYDDAAAARTLSFRVGDVFMSAIFAAANEELAAIGDELGLGATGELLEYADRYRKGVVGTAGDDGFAADIDLRTEQAVPAPTIAGFAPLICGGLDAPRQRALVELLEGPQWCGNPSLAFAVPPSTRPGAEGFDPGRYWRGPQWPPMNWLLAWGLERCGEPAAAARLRAATSAQLADGLFAEYYEPFTGRPLGAQPQSWSAAVALDLLARP
ncbi:glucosylglycerate hydrolase [Allonocardiopsis opalescens]|uniref:Mannosylglycerate hydrolase MGH1-like glycoside hydrolase domain-containing protein n=1 Tax=Allonocardiopsis opalescens TaxID=1144618 RepID=A0A2T0PV94_9ACTN|nr:glycogen debranching protein [Allonocardiopsis opalescens]PRX95454.1 hypothetical protein CLV72_10962 [Allonocardiopsis opalescens]